MEKGYQAAINALGEMLLQQKNEIAYRGYEIERKDKEIDNLQKELDSVKAKIESIEKYISFYEIE